MNGTTQNAGHHTLPQSTLSPFYISPAKLADITLIPETMKTSDLTCRYCLKRVLSCAGMAKHIRSCRKNPTNWCQHSAYEPRAISHSIKRRRNAQTLPLIAAYARDLLRAPQPQVDSTHTHSNRASSNMQDTGSYLETHRFLRMPGPVQDVKEFDMPVLSQCVEEVEIEEGPLECALPLSNSSTTGTLTTTSRSGIISATSLQSLFQVTYKSNNGVPAGLGWRAGQRYIVLHSCSLQPTLPTLANATLGMGFI